MSAAIKDSPYQVQVLDRALGILDVLSSENHEMAPADLSERLELHKSTAHRLLMVLERHRLIEKDAQSGKYRLGLKLFELGSRAVAQLNLSERARPYLERLVLETGETAHLCIVDNDETLSLTNVESSRTVRAPVTVGRRTPVHCTAVGKSVLAFMGEDELRALVKRRGLKPCTLNTITTLSALRTELRLVRERGYAVDNEEIEADLKCIGAPVRDYSGNVVAAVSIAGPAFRMTDDKVPVIARLLIAAAAELSIELGYQETAGSKAVSSRVDL